MMPKTLHVTMPDGERRTVRLTRHARQRAEEMGVEPMDIARAALAPDCWYRGSDTSGRTRVQRQDDSEIAVVFDPRNSVVVTVLWHTLDDYTRPEKEATR